jgi:hypothetical protein
MEAKFESANRRYGIPSRCVRAYHACNNGLVEESRKYGSPTVTESSARMVREGCAAPTLFQPGWGRMGSAAKLTARAAM